jgi:hypothetical protein
MSIASVAVAVVETVALQVLIAVVAVAGNCCFAIVLGVMTNSFNCSSTLFGWISPD